MLRQTTSSLFGPHVLCSSQDNCKSEHLYNPQPSIANTTRWTQCLNKYSYCNIALDVPSAQRGGASETFLFCLSLNISDFQQFCDSNSNKPRNVAMAIVYKNLKQPIYSSYTICDKNRICVFVHVFPLLF